MSSHESHVLVETLAWTLIHFVWQGALIAVLLWLALAVLGEVSSRVRYLVRCAALAFMAFLPLLTFAWLWGEAPPLPVVSASSGAPLAELPVAALESLWSQPLMWVAALWSFGALLCVLRFSGGLLQVVRLRRSHVGIDLSPRWQRRFESLARDFGVRVRARVVESSAVCVPAVIGCIKPVVLLPARLFSGLTDAQIEALLAHELAHVARHDYLVNIVQSVVESLLFYHPAVWWVSRGIRVEREYCCDDLAVAATRNGLAYAHALTALESWRGAQPQLGVSTLGGSLMSRIQRLVGLEPERPRRAVRPAHAIAGLFVAGTLSASAFAFATLPEPAACDCKCACHQRAAKARAEKQAHAWIVAPDHESRVRRNEVIHLNDVFELNDQEHVVNDFTEVDEGAARKMKFIVELKGGEGEERTAVLEVLAQAGDGESCEDLRKFLDVEVEQDGDPGSKRIVVVVDGTGPDSEKAFIELEGMDVPVLGIDTLLFQADGDGATQRFRIGKPHAEAGARGQYRVLFSEDIEGGEDAPKILHFESPMEGGAWINVAPRLDTNSGGLEIETRLRKFEGHVRFFDPSMNRVHVGHGGSARKNVVVELLNVDGTEDAERVEVLLKRYRDAAPESDKWRRDASRAPRAELQQELERLRKQVEVLKKALEGQVQRGELHKFKAKR